MLSFYIFAENKCEYVVLECGIGGQLDSTNIVEAADVACTAITSIGNDHTEVLGNTLEDIAK